MADYTELKGLNELRATGVHLSAKAAEYQGKVAGITGNIQSIAGTDGHVPPAGADHFGDEFRKGYNGEDGKASTDMVKAVTDSPESLTKLGDGLVTFASDMQGVDMEEHGKIKSTEA